MQQLIHWIIREQLHQDPAIWPYTEFLYALGMIVAGGIGTSFAAIFSGILSWYERKIAARIQSRIGPNRAGPHGSLVWLADAIKLLMKEDLIPADADPFLFRMAPYFVVTGTVLTFVALPFSHFLVATDMNIGLFYILSITALVVVGILMSGWSSNSKWALFGGIRSAAQVVSYEIPAGMAVLIPVMMAGSLSMQELIRVQGGIQEAALGANFITTGGWPWNWTLFQSPMAFISFFIFFTAALAEGNRTPFDLPEAESELVAGYCTEYSGMRFSYFFLAEWANVWVMSALATTIYLGGWQIPGVPLKMLDAGSFPLEIISLVIFVTKVLVLINIVVWLRWTLPRIRVDQMMNLCWKYLVPISMVLVLITALNEWVMGSVPANILVYVHMGFFAVAGAIPAVLFFKQTAKNIKIMGDQVDLGNW